jgi:Spy/CpxP family protein refolding chaperone
MAAMKSAVELAMEKLGKQQGQASSTPLTDEQRRQISDLRHQYDAKIAEKEIMAQSEIRKVIQRRPPHEAAATVQALQQQLQEAKAALREELEGKIAAIRGQ